MPHTLIPLFSVTLTTFWTKENKILEIEHDDERERSVRVGRGRRVNIAKCRFRQNVVPNY